MNPSVNELLKIYANCLRSRRLDEELQNCYYSDPEWKRPDGIVRSLHSAIGNELGESAVACFMQSEDFLVARYRGYAALLGKGMNPERIVAEVLRKKIGPTKGLGGNSLFHDTERNIFGSSLILGSNFSTAVGLALAKKIKNAAGIVVLFFGDGEASRPAFCGALNLAALWELPLLLVCENDGVSLDASIRETSATPTIAERAKGFRVECATLSMSDPLAFAARAKEVVRNVREQRTPFLLEILEERHAPQSTFSDDKPFLGEMIPREKDPLTLFEKELVRLGIDSSTLAGRKTDAERAIAAAKAVAEQAEQISADEFLSIFYE